jgi:transposase-like protein
LTDIPHQGFAPGRMSGHGEHGEEEAPAAPLVHAGVQGQIVELCQREDRSVGQVARDLDLTETAVREWVKQAERDAGTRQDGGLTRTERAELIELRRECRQLREDVGWEAALTTPGRFGTARRVRQTRWRGVRRDGEAYVRNQRRKPGHMAKGGGKFAVAGLACQ